MTDRSPPTATFSLFPACLFNIRTRMIYGAWLLFFLMLPLSASGQHYEVREFSYRNQLPASEVFFVTQDEQGLWYFGTSLGLQVFDGVSFTPFFGADVSTNISHAACRAGFFADGRIYLGYTNRQYSIDVKTRKIVASLSLPGVPRYFDFLGGKIIYVSSDDGIYEINPGAFSINRFKPLQDIFYCARKNRNTLYLADINWRAFQFSLSSGLQPLNNGKPIDPLSEHFIHPDGFISGIDAGNGQIIGDNPQEINRVLRIKNEEVHKGLPLCTRMYHFLNLYKDRNNMIWLTTSKSVLLLYEQKKEHKKLLENKSVRYIYTDKLNNQFISTYDGNYLRKSGQADFRLMQNLGGVAWTSIPVNEDGSEILLLGVNTIKNILNLKTGKLKPVSWIPVNTHIYCSLYNGQGSYLLFGTGIYELNYQAQRLSMIDDRVKTTGIIYAAAPIKDQEYVICASKGSFVYSMVTGEFTKLDNAESRWMIQKGKSVIIGTLGNGLLFYDFISKKIRHIKTSFSDIDQGFCYAGLTDADGRHAWVGTASGLYRVNLSNWKATYFQTPCKEFNTAALCYTSDGVLLAGSTDGIAQISIPAVQRKSPYSAWLPPFICGIRSYKAGQAYGVKKFLPQGEAIYISPNTLATEIYFGSPSVFLQPSVHYRYRINGYTDSWIHMVTNNNDAPVIHLTRLPAGSYTLDIQSQYPDGNWSASRTTDIYAEPAYYETWWFRLTISALLAVIIYLFTRYLYKENLRKLREKARLSELNERVSKSELIALRNQITPHMLANSLQTAQFFIYNNDAVAAADYLSKFSGLMRKTLEMGSTDIVSLAVEVSFLESYIDLEIIKLDKAVESAIDILYIENPGKIMIPSMVVQPFIENAFKHGLRNTPSDVDAKIFIRFELVHEDLICTIFNTGPQKAFTVNQERISGNTISLARINLYAELFNVKSSVNNLPTENGVTVRIQIPYKIVYDE